MRVRAPPEPEVEPRPAWLRGAGATCSRAEPALPGADQAGVQREQLLEVAFCRTTAHGTFPEGGEVVGPGVAGSCGPPPSRAAWAYWASGRLHRGYGGAAGRLRWPTAGRADRWSAERSRKCRRDRCAAPIPSSRSTDQRSVATHSRFAARNRNAQGAFRAGIRKGLRPFPLPAVCEFAHPPPRSRSC